MSKHEIVMANLINRKNPAICYRGDCGSLLLPIAYIVPAKGVDRKVFDQLIEGTILMLLCENADQLLDHFYTEWEKVQ